MSKSSDNTIALMVDATVATKVSGGSSPIHSPDQPKDPDACTVVTLLRAFAGAATTREAEARYRSGGIGYGEVKTLLTEIIERHVALCATVTSNCSPIRPRSSDDSSRTSTASPDAQTRCSLVRWVDMGC